MATANLVTMLKDIRGENATSGEATSGIWYELVKNPNPNLSQYTGGLANVLSTKADSVSGVSDDLYGVGGTSANPVGGSVYANILDTKDKVITSYNTLVGEDGKSGITKTVLDKVNEFTNSDGTGKYDTFEVQYTELSPHLDDDETPGSIVAVYRDLKGLNIDGTDKEDAENGESYVQIVGSNLLKGTASTVDVVGKDLLAEESKISKVEDKLDTDILTVSEAITDIGTVATAKNDVVTVATDLSADESKIAIVYDDLTNSAKKYMETIVDDMLDSEKQYIETTATNIKKGGGSEVIAVGANLLLSSSDIVEVSKALPDIQDVNANYGNINVVSDNMDKVNVLYNDMKDDGEHAIVNVEAAIDDIVYINANISNIEDIVDELDNIKRVNDDLALDDDSTIRIVSGNISYVEDIAVDMDKSGTDPDADDYSHIRHAASNAISATDDADLARRWASEDEDIEITSGKYSSKHYNIYAKQYMDTTLEARDTTQELSDNMHNLSVDANTLTAGSDSSVSYDSGENKLTFGIPEGTKGDRGDSFTIDATGLFADRVDYDDKDSGFGFLSTDGYGPQPDVTIDTNFDGDLDLGTDASLEWDGDDLEEIDYRYILNVTNMTTGKLSLVDDTTIVAEFVSDGEYTIEHTTTSNIIKLETDADYDGTVDILIEKVVDTNANIFFKNSDTSGDWSNGSPFGKGDTGDTGVSIIDITRTDGDGSVGSVDTYTITMDDGTLHTFTIANGNEYTDEMAVASVSDTELTFTNKTIEDITNKISANIIHLKMVAGEDLVKGDIVTVSGYSTTEEAIKVVKTVDQTDMVIGIVLEDVATDGVGKILNTGMISGLDTSDYSAGDILYSAGDNGYTTTKPDGLYQTIGSVLRSDADTGVLYVECTDSKKNIDNIDNTSDVDKPISTATQDALDAKVATANIVDAVDDTSTDKPLSANQGKLLNDAIVTLNADDATDGSVAYAVKELSDGQVTTNKNDIATLNGDDTVDASVDNKIKTQVLDNIVDNTTDGGSTKILSAEQGKNLQSDIDTLNSDETVEGSVAKSIKDSKVTKAVGTAALNRYDKILSTLDVVEMKYDDNGVLTTVRYDGDGDTDAPYYRDELEYTDDKLTKVSHYYNTEDLDTASSTTDMTYDGDNLTAVSYNE